MRLPKWLFRFDQTVISWVRKYSVAMLRVALGVVFVWFGALKILGISPVAGLVAKTLYFLPPHVAVVGMGVVEVIIGLGLLSGLAMRLTLLLFVAQMMGTFLTMVIRPDLTFTDGNPFKLSANGEFIIKNLVLISAGLVVLGTVRKARPRERVHEVLGREAHTASSNPADTSA